MVLFQDVCSCSASGAKPDLLQCAPCPPPMLTYQEFRDHALNQSLCQAEVCNIAGRCGLLGEADVTADCSPGTQYGCDLTCIISIVCVMGVVAIISTVIVVTVKHKRLAKPKEHDNHSCVAQGAFYSDQTDTVQRVCTGGAVADINQNQRTEIIKIRTQNMSDICTQATIDVGIVTANDILDLNVRIERVAQVEQVEDITRVQLSDVAKTERKYSSDKALAFKLESQSDHRVDKHITSTYPKLLSHTKIENGGHFNEIYNLKNETTFSTYM